MVYVGIVGALSPQGKALVKLIGAQSEKYRIVFLYDKNLESSRQKNEYSSLEDALLLNTPTLVVDVEGSDGVYERIKQYRYYDMPALIIGAKLSEEDKNTLECLRRASLTSPTVVMEHSLDYYMEVLMQQASALVKLQAENVDQVRILVQTLEEPAKQAAKFLPLLHTFNKLLGVNEKAFPMSSKREKGGLMSTWQCGLVQLEIAKLATGPIDTSIWINVVLTNADERADNTATTHTVSYEYAGCYEDSLRRGLMQMLEYIGMRLNAVEGKIETDMLPRILRQCM